MKKLKIIGVPMHLGADTYGINDGIYELQKSDETLRTIDMVNINYDSTKDLHEPNLKYINCITNCCEELASITDATIKNGDFPFILGGDHSIGLGSVSGVANSKRIGVVWLDAHADMNHDKNTPTGNIHGMPLAALQGYGDERLVNLYKKGVKVKEEDVLVFGARALDPLEKIFVKGLNNTIMYCDDIHKKGLPKSLDEAYSIVSKNTDGVHLSIDLDSMNTDECPGVSVPVFEGGFTAAEVLESVEYFLKTGKLTSIDLVEFNPVLDKDDKTKKIALKIINLIKKYYA